MLWEELIIEEIITFICSKNKLWWSNEKEWNKGSINWIILYMYVIINI